MTIFQITLCTALGLSLLTTISCNNKHSQKECATFGYSILHDEGKYANGLLTREKPINIRKIALPGANEARTAQIVELEKYVVVNTHLSQRGGTAPVCADHHGSGEGERQTCFPNWRPECNTRFYADAVFKRAVANAHQPQPQHLAIHEPKSDHRLHIGVYGQSG